MTLAARRFLVVPDAAFDDATVVSATATADGSRQEAGRQVDQPDRSAATPPEGDIALTLSGEPEVHVEGVARVTRGGVVEDARWGWVRDGDNADTDLQFRQSPHVVGRRMDCLINIQHDIPSNSSRPVRPRLLALKSGDALLVYTLRYWDPIWARDATTLALAVESIYWSRLDHTNDTWSEPNFGPVPFDLAGGLYFISAVDITQFPDTGEIVMCVATNDNMDPGSTSVRMLWVYVSFDDGGTWTLRHRLFFDGTIPDIVLDTDGDGDTDDTTPIQDWALELLDSGRLCLVMCTEDNTWSLTSDDRGASWSATLVAAHIAARQYAGHGVGATKARNGMAVFTIGLRDTAAFGNPPIVRFTRDGQTFGAAIELDDSPYLYATVDVTACVAPDGWVHVYGTEHSTVTGGTPAPQDWLWGRRLTVRDPGLSETVETVLPTYAAGTVLGPICGFHIGGGTALGNYTTGLQASSPVYGGFLGLDAILYRGQVLMAAVALQEQTPAPDPAAQAKLASSGLIIYRLNHWQPLQEQLGNLYQDPDYTPARPAQGRAYNRTWDCYGLPTNWGFTLTGSAGTMVAAGAEGGYLQLAASPSYYSDTTLPASGATATMDAALRVVMHAESGGDLTADDIAVRLQVASAAGNHTDVSIRFLRTGDDVKIRVYDNIGAAAVGSDVTLVGTGWIEVVYTQRQTAATTYDILCYARAYPRSTDPDWDEPYSEVVGTAVAALNTAVSAAELLRFGHISSGDNESWWKGVHLHRPNSLDECALAQEGLAYIDNDGTNDRTLTGTGEAPLDNGLDNWMRTCRTLAVPPMFLSRNVYARFRGEAVTEGDFDYTTDYVYAARNVLLQPVMREWRSVDDGVKCSIVLQAPSDCGFRPDALAVFGHNCTGFTIQFNDVNTDVGWAAPAVTMQFGLPNMPGFTPDRYYHLWAYGYDESVGWYFLITGCRVVITGPAGEQPWRPHQFKSDEGSSGQQFYVAFSATSGGNTWAFRILDNTGDTLILESNPGDSGIITGDAIGDPIFYNFSIFSDRFAVMIGHHMDADPGVGYEFCRVQTRATYHPDAGRDFARVGRMVFGSTIELSTPDFERGWSTGFDDGSELVEQPTGAAYSHRKRPMLRTWQADRPWMMPPAEATQVFNSPDDIDTRASWQQWIDAVRRIDGVRTACALVWEGARFVGFDGEELVQCCADPKDLAMCHVTGIGDLENDIYDGRNENLAGGTTCVPLPVSHIRGLQFRETL